MGEAYTRTSIRHITDTTDISDAVLRLEDAYTRFMGLYGIRDADVRVTPAFTTLEIGAAVSNAITNQCRPERLVLAVNCAPPDKDKKGSATNHRRDFVCAELDDNTVVCGTLNGFELSYVKNRIKNLYQLTNTNHTNSQFRSLEVLPEATLRFSQPEERGKMLAEGKLAPLDIATAVPSPPDETHVFRVDNFGNVGLYLSQTDRAKLTAANGRKIKIKFAKASLEVGGWNAHRYFKPFRAVAREVFFANKKRDFVLTMSSSTKLADGSTMPQVIDLRDVSTIPTPRFRVPPVGARVKLVF